MQLYELEKRLTMDVKHLAKKYNIKMDNIYVNVQTGKGMMGFYSKKRWIVGEEKNKVDELALNPEHFNDPIELCDTIIHELVHVYCDQNSIKDTSRNGYYHNAKFKKIAEQFGLICVSCDSGWNTTTDGNAEFLNSINQELPYPITGDMIRRSDSAKKSTRSPRKKAKVYTCPLCNKEIKHKDLIYIKCAEDDSLYQLDDDDEAYNDWADHVEDLVLMGRIQR